MRARCLSSILLAALAMALVAGCGGSSGSSGSTAAEAPAGPTELTKAQFIAKADAICAATNDSESALRGSFEELQRSQAPTAQRELGEAMSALARDGAKESEEIRALVPPKKDAKEVERLIAKEESANAVAAEAAAALEAGNAAKFYGLLESISAQGAVAQGFAEGYGLRVCGQ
jgi:hypothetical protein